MYPKDDHLFVSKGATPSILKKSEYLYQLAESICIEIALL